MFEDMYTENKEQPSQKTLAETEREEILGDHWQPTEEELAGMTPEQHRKYYERVLSKLQPEQRINLGIEAEHRRIEAIKSANLAKIGNVEPGKKMSPGEKIRAGMDVERGISRQAIEAEERDRIQRFKDAQDPTTKKIHAGLQKEAAIREELEKKYRQ